MKKLLIFVLLPVVLLIGAGLGAALMGLVPDFGLRVALGQPFVAFAFGAVEVKLRWLRN